MQKYQTPTRKRVESGPSFQKKRSDKKKKLLRLFLARARVLVFCFLGVICHRALDIAGETFSLAGVGFEYLAFSFVVSIFLFLWLERREVPGSLSAKKKTEILRRLAFNAWVAGFNVQVFVAKLEEVVQ